MEHIEPQSENLSIDPGLVSDSIGEKSGEKSNVNSSRSASQSKQRYTIDFKQGAANEVKRIKEMFNLTTTDVFRYALSLMRIYADAKAKNKEVHIVDPQNPRVAKVIELPLFSNTSKEGGPS